MGGRNGHNGTSRSLLLEKRLTEAQEENVQLETANVTLTKRVGDLVKVNDAQLQRLVSEELLRSRIRELEEQIRRDAE
jgi:hypothetical protein